jgi:hypothetical protein
MALQPYDQETERPISSAFNAGLNKLVAQALAEKSLMWFSAAGSLGLWTYAILHPDPLRLVAAAGYSLLCQLLPLFKRS